MQNKFIGRQAELNLLNSEYNSSKSNFIPIYGRRRVGKSELVLQFIRNKPHIYFLGKKIPSELLLQELLEIAAQQTRRPVIGSIATSNWQKAINHIIDEWQTKKKIILVFDEFQWLAESVPGIISILQQLWDLSWFRSGKVMLILCGSFIGFMEKKILGRKSPLFGRRTAQIFLKPFNFKEAGDFHPNYSCLDKAKTYFICGGIPLYLKSFSPRVSIKKNIQNNFLNEYSPLFYEPEFLLREELREVENYYAVLLGLARGINTNKEISRFSSINVRALNYYLKNLMALHYIRKRYPVSGSRSHAQNVHYIIDDPLLRFWFRFVFPNLSFLKSTGESRTVIEKINPQLDAYFGYCFENLCREALIYIYQHEQIEVLYTIGEYWDKNIQIDVVGTRDDNRIDIGECKWGKIKSLKTLRDELEGKVRKYPNENNATLQLRLFTVKPVNKVLLQGIKCYSLQDIYEL